MRRTLSFLFAMFVAFGPLGGDALAGRRKAAEVGAPFPASGPNESFEVRPGELSLRVTTHTFQDRSGPVPCWVIATEGLAAKGQKELVFLIKHKDGDTAKSLAHQLGGLASAVYDEASRGNLVDVGDLTTLDPRHDGLLGRKDLLGVLYWVPVAGLHVPEPYLNAIIVDEREAQIANRVGVGRITARLGDQVRYYPTSHWTDRDRESVAGSDKAEAESLAQKLPLASVHGLQVLRRPAPGEDSSHVAGGGIVLSLPTDAVPAMVHAYSQIDGLPADRDGARPPFGFIGVQGFECDGQLVWRPGDTDAHAIMPGTAPPRQMCGNFVTLVPWKEESCWRLIEDGYALLLSTRELAAVRQALTTGVPLSLLDAAGQPLLQIEWTTADGVRPKPPEGPAALKSVVLLTSEDEIAERTNARDLSRYLLALVAAAEPSLSAASPGTPGTLAVRVTLRPGQAPAILLSADPALPEAQIAALQTAFAAVSAPVPTGEVAFQLNVTLWGGVGP